MRHLLAFSAILALAASLWSCKDSHKERYNLAIDPETFATMTTTDVNTVISDSGILRYRILAPIWLVYDEASDPSWRFNYGMHMERYDNAMKINATIDCDSAIYYSTRDIWDLFGAVDIHSSDKQRFLTEHLTWNRMTRQVYTDSFIHIERPDRIIEGYGLRSNDEFTDYVIIRPTGSFPASQFRPDPDNQIGNPYDPTLVAGADPVDAQRTDTAFNGIPTDTVFVSTQPSAPARKIRPLRLPRTRPDTAAFVEPARLDPVEAQ